jgi:hypothetical protein
MPSRLVQNIRHRLERKPLSAGFLKNFEKVTIILYD